MSHQSGQVEILHADTGRQLSNAIQGLAINVPPRGPGRTTDDCEQWQIHRLLSALLQAGELHLPVTLTKRERPDFVLKTARVTVGIEATEAINPDYVQAIMHPNARQPSSVVDPSLYRWGTEGRSREQIAEEAGRKGLTGDGWVGVDVFECEFAEMVADIVRRKTAKLRDGYERFDRDCLLIYDNQTFASLDETVTRRYAQDKLRPLWASSGFHTVYVVDDGQKVLELTARGSRVL